MTFRIDDVLRAFGLLVLSFDGIDVSPNVGVFSSSSISAAYGSNSSTLGYVILTGDALDPCLLG